MRLTLGLSFLNPNENIWLQYVLMAELAYVTGWPPRRIQNSTAMLTFGIFAESVIQSCVVVCSVLSNKWWRHCCRSPDIKRSCKILAACFPLFQLPKYCVFVAQQLFGLHLKRHSISLSLSLSSQPTIWRFEIRLNTWYKDSFYITLKNKTPKTTSIHQFRPALGTITHHFFGVNIIFVFFCFNCTHTHTCNCFERLQIKLHIKANVIVHALENRVIR